MTCFSSCRCVTNNSMRLFVIGHHGKGKTTLLRALKTSSAASNGLLASIIRTSSDAHAHPPTGKGWPLLCMYVYFALHI